MLLLREELSSLQSATSSTTNTMSDREMEMMPKETEDNFDRTVHAKNQVREMINCTVPMMMMTVIGDEKSGVRIDMRVMMVYQQG